LYTNERLFVFIGNVERGGKVSGFYKRLINFDFIFLSELMINIFERIDVVNTVLQSTPLRFKETRYKINNVIKLVQKNTGFEDLRGD